MLEFLKVYGVLLGLCAVIITLCAVIALCIIRLKALEKKLTQTEEKIGRDTDIKIEALKKELKEDSRRSRKAMNLGLAGMEENISRAIEGKKSY